VLKTDLVDITLLIYFKDFSMYILQTRILYLLIIFFISFAASMSKIVWLVNRRFRSLV